VCQEQSVELTAGWCFIKDGGRSSVQAERSDCTNHLKLLISKDFGGERLRKGWSSPVR
jgi:hypothetical protein